MVVTGEKSVDNQSHLGVSSGDLECLDKISQQSIQKLEKDISV